MTGFKDHYKKIELLGSGSFATVNTFFKWKKKL